MTLRNFIAKHFILFDKAMDFRLWLGKIRGTILPEKEWLKLWKEFNNGK